AAEAQYRQAIAVALGEPAPDELNVAMARSNLAMVMQSKSHYADALELQQQALATARKMLGAEHPLTLAMTRDAALSYAHLGRYAKARPLMEELLATQRKKAGADHPAVAGVEINLGALLLDMGAVDEAERVLTDSLAIFTRRFGRNHQGARTAL